MKNSYEFRECLCNNVFPGDVVIASFDITNLFTNVPISETVNIASDLLYAENGSVRNMTKTQFKKLLELITGDNHFIFNNNHMFRRKKVITSHSPGEYPYSPGEYSFIYNK